MWRQHKVHRSISWCLGVAWLFFVSSAFAQGFDYPNFANLKELVLGGRTAELSASSAKRKILTLTDSTSQVGGAFRIQRIALKQGNSFSTWFSFRIHKPSGDTDSDGVQGADGIAFVIQTENNQIGGMGVGIGYEGLKPSLIVEFDTWNNFPPIDPDGNHIGINLHGELKSLATHSLKTPLNNGKVWYAWIDYHGPTKRLQVRISQTSKRPTKAALTRTIDLVKELKRPDVYVGFTSGTGASGNQHDILRWHFRGQYSPFEDSPQGQLWVQEQTPHLVTPDQLGIILDASCSMLARVSKRERRIDLAKRILRELLPELPPQLEVGLVAYGHRYRPYPRTQSCKDIELVVPFAPFAQEGFFRALQKIRPRGETPIGRAMAQLSKAFKPSQAPKWIVVLSDGMETCDPKPKHPFYPLRVIQSLRQKGINARIQLVGLGIRQKRTRQFLQRIATSGGGTYFDTHRQKDLKQALRKALAVQFVVRDAKRRAVATGYVGANEISVPPGQYTLDILSIPPILGQPVIIRKQQTTQILIARLQGKLQLLDKSGTKTGLSTTASPGPSREITQVAPQRVVIAKKTMIPKSTTPTKTNHTQQIPSTNAHPTAPTTTRSFASQGKLTQANGIWNYQATLPSLAMLQHSYCFSNISTSATVDSLFQRISREISLQIYDGFLRGVMGTCMAKAANSLEQSILLAHLLQLRKETVRIAQITLTPLEQQRIYRASMQREFQRFAGLLKRAKARETNFLKALANLPDATAKNGTLEMFTDTPSRKQLQQALFNIHAFLQIRPEQLTQAALTQLRQVLPITQAQMRALMQQKAATLKASLTRHTWVQWKRGGHWIDLDPSMKLPLGSSLRAPEQTFSLVQILQTSPRHRIQLQLTATFQAGKERKTLPILQLHTDSTALTAVPLALLFASTQKSEGAQIAGALHKFLKPHEGGIPYRPVLYIGTQPIEGHPLTLKDWRSTPTPAPFGLSGLDRNPPAQQIQRPELASLWWSVRYLPPQGKIEHHQRPLLDRVGLAQAQTSGAWTVQPLSSRALQKLKSIRSFGVFTGRLPRNFSKAPLFASPHPILHSQFSALVALQTYMQHQHSDVFAGRSFGYLAKPSIFGVEMGSSVHTPAKNAALKDPATSHFAMDMMQQGWFSLRYDDPARTGLISAAVEHAFGEWLSLFATGQPRAPFSVFTTFHQAHVSRIPLRLVRTPAELASMAISADHKASILPLLGRYWIVVPEKPVTIGKTPRLAWLRIDPTSGEVADQTDTFAGSTYTEYASKVWEELKTAKGIACLSVGITAAITIANLFFGDSVGPTTRNLTILNMIVSAVSGLTGGECHAAVGRLELIIVGFPLGAIISALLKSSSSPQPATQPTTPPSVYYIIPAPSTPAPPKDLPPDAARPRRPRNPRPRRPRWTGPRPLDYQHRSGGYYEIEH